MFAPPPGPAQLTEPEKRLLMLYSRAKRVIEPMMDDEYMLASNQALKEVRANRFLEGGCGGLCC